MPQNYDQWEQPICDNDFVPEDIFHEDNTFGDYDYFNNDDIQCEDIWEQDNW